MIEPAILHYCRYQERCHTEVRNKLYELGFTSNTVEQQIAELIGADVLNEERYARSYARGHWRMKQWGRNKIVYNLKQKKISDYCIKKALTEIDGDEYARILDMLTKKKKAELKSEKNIFTKKGKIYRFLVQKGYEQDLVKDSIAANI